MGQRFDAKYSTETRPITNHCVYYDQTTCNCAHRSRQKYSRKTHSLPRGRSRNKYNTLTMSDMKLAANTAFPKRDGPIALIVLDGVGLAPDKAWNAVTTADTRFLDALLAGKGPNGTPTLYTELEASGKSVGLPSNGDMGNSEVGHNALGAGRVFDQGAKLVNNSFASGSFKEGQVWKWLLERCASPADGTLHLLGLYSDGNVHAHVNHVYQLLDAAIDGGVKRIRLHVLADGRDVSERSVLEYLGPLEKRLTAVRATGVDARIASGGGRMVVTMDRYEADWGIVERGWNAHVLGDTTRIAPFPSATAAIEKFYADGINDQYLPPFVIVDDSGQAVGPVEDGDSLLFWNFRGDRAIEISKAFEAPQGQFDHFQRIRVPDVRYAGMMQYDGDANIPSNFLVSPPTIDRTVAEFCVKNGLKRYSVSETQKFGHVTYFYNGNRNAKFDETLEKYTCIESFKQKENTRPWMKCDAITDEALKELDEFKPDLMVINYANGDMVGHTGDTRASRLAMACVDLCLERLVPAIIEKGGIVVLTADHGNCDIMAELDKKTGEPKAGNQPEGWKALVSHTKQRVPCVIVGKGMDKYEVDAAVTWGGESTYAGIANLGATTLNLLGLESPSNYVASILKKKV